jgi:hypothetical protein
MTSLLFKDGAEIRAELNAKIKELLFILGEFVRIINSNSRNPVPSFSQRFTQCLQSLNISCHTVAILLRYAMPGMSKCAFNNLQYRTVRLQRLLTSRVTVYAINNNLCPTGQPAP